SDSVGAPSPRARLVRVGNYKVKNRVVVRFMRRSSGASYQKLEITQVTKPDSSKGVIIEQVPRSLRTSAFSAFRPIFTQRPQRLIMKRSIYAFLVIVALSRFGLAQNDARELWLVRSQTLTSDLLKDAADLSPQQRAVLWAKLAQRWWREDPKRARIWVLNAIEVVDQVPNKETPKEREKRLETTRV